MRRSRPPMWTHCVRAPRTRRSWQRRTGWHAARTAGSDPRAYLLIFVVHRSYPQVRFSTWGQVDNEGAFSRHIRLQFPASPTGGQATLRPPVSCTPFPGVTPGAPFPLESGDLEGLDGPIPGLRNDHFRASTDLSHTLWITFPDRGFLWTITPQVPFSTRKSGQPGARAAPRSGDSAALH